MVMGVGERDCGEDSWVLMQGVAAELAVTKGRLAVAISERYKIETSCNDWRACDACDDLSGIAADAAMHSKLSGPKLPPKLRFAVIGLAGRGGWSGLPATSRPGLGLVVRPAASRKDAGCESSTQPAPASCSLEAVLLQPGLLQAHNIQAPLSPYPNI
ncbi:hypothetical protein HaLaN_09634 [Haematococcus lacustris]|uniref:Uncharacterized protein n=1 Tax=Haematococcus lacustris TaxID=44745 RepID=A0A699Z3S4_HAELA|nr:hypothetical protein HaLaN_09634 [Haematococcus lacustris]